MTKKITILLIVCFSLYMTLKPGYITFAQVSNLEYRASEDMYYIHFDPTGVESFDFTNHETGGYVKYDYMGQNYSTFRCNAPFTMKFYNANGEVISTYNGETTQVVNEPAGCQPDDGDSGSGGNCGCVFNTPGWQEYMGKIEEIIAKIPPPPNWDSVAEKFRDKILPAYFDQLEDLIGSNPAKPSPPSEYPRVRGDIEPPTGNLPDGFKDSSFTADDIKNSALDIPEREDPTGGFNIFDPIKSLPSQEEFKENIPNEGDNYAPEVPDVEGTAPTPPEKDNPLPGDPEDPENIAPTPPDVSGTAPTPPEQDNPYPGSPDEGGTAPIPGDGGGTAPTPGDDIGTAPIPGETGETAPLPGQDNSTAPIPGADNSAAPLPNQDGSTAPIP
jgi:hypothetical protein